MQLFKIVGNWLRGLYLMGFGGFWLGCAYYCSGLGEFGPGKPTVLGLSIFGTLFFGAGLVIFVRGLLFTAQRAPLPKEAVGWRDDGKKSEAEGDFDADAAIARYMARKPSTAAEQSPSQAEQPAPALRPQFGRRGL
jgi:hypothetical protein